MFSGAGPIGCYVGARLLAGGSAPLRQHQALFTFADRHPHLTE
jgi:hypothetical protein